MTQDYVIGKLREIAGKDASDAQDSNLRYSSKIKALELLGKHVGAWEPPKDTGPKDEIEEDDLSRSLRELGEGLERDD